MDELYYYGNEADQFTFYRMPKLLFTDSKYDDLSLESKVLYGMLLDRMSLSIKNGWLDQNGRVYIIYTIEQVMQTLKCGNKKAVAILNELEKKANLIEKKRRGLGKPNIIYVKRFVSSEYGNVCKCQNNNSSELSSAETSNKEDSINVLETIQEYSDEQCNKTDLSENNLNDINQSIISSSKKESCELQSNQEMDEMEDDFSLRDFFTDSFKMNFDYDLIQPSEFKDRVEEVIQILVDICCSKSKTINISGIEIPHEIVVERFRGLELKHLKYVFNSLDHNVKSKVRNVKQYLIVSLYNATVTYVNDEKMLENRLIDSYDELHNRA